MSGRKNATLSATVPLNKRASCGTNATFDAHQRRSTSWMSMSPAAMTPAVGERTPSRSWMSVDLPLPDGPTTPMASPGSIWNDSWCRTGRPGT